MEVEKEKVSPFAWVDLLSTGAGPNLMAEHGESAFPTFMVNRAFSYHPDTMLYAAEVNLYPDLPKRLVYDYYRTAVRPKKRWAKWGKRKNSEHVQLVMDHYRVSWRAAVQYLRVLTPEQIETIGELQKHLEG